MILKQQVPEILLKACPSFHVVYDVYDEEDKELYYTVSRDFTYHILELFKANDTSEFPEIAKAIEDFHVDGDPFVQELASIGFLESIQNVWGHSDIDPEEMAPFLHPVSLKYWNSLNEFWQGKIPAVGSVISDNPEQVQIADQPARGFFKRMPSLWTVLSVIVVLYMIYTQI